MRIHFALIVFLTVLTSIVGIQPVIAPYTSDGQDFILAGPINIISPTNITYTSNILILNVSTTYLLGPDYANLCYSIDGKNNITIPLTGTQEPREITRTYENGTIVVINSTLNVPFILNGEATLSGLSEGSHNLVVYGNYTANTDIGYDDCRVYFTIDTSSQPRYEPKNGLEDSDPISSFFSFFIDDISKGLAPLMLIVTIIFVSLFLVLNHKRKQKQGTGIH
ncbi:hypothetical protein ACFLRN_08470 [Thermoproteota archaeon]